MKTDSRPKPCLFCGNPNVLFRNVEYDKSIWLIECNQCHMEFSVNRRYDFTGRHISNHDAVLELWNNRKDGQTE